MKLQKFLAVFGLSVLVSFSANAQKNYLKDAEAAFANEQYYSAKDLFKTAAEKEKKIDKKVYSLFMVGECYRFMTDADQAETYYNRAIEGKYKDNIVYLRIADAQREQGKYKEAEKNYQKFLDASGDKRGKDGVESCKLAQELMKNKTRHIVEAEDILNTPEYDFSPMFGDRKNAEMYFSSSRAGGVGTGQDMRTGGNYTDLWLTIRDKKGKWSEPTPLPADINTEDNEGAVTFNRKGDVMYYTNCPNEKKQNLGCDIYMIEKKGGKWGAREKLNLKGHDSITVGHPAISPDDKFLIFASDLPGGQGGKDLWITTFDRRNKTWTEPVNLGPKINTPGDEMFPYIHDDGSLYFASDGHIGMGGLDMFRAESTGENQWGNPTNLGFPLNSPQHDFGIVFEDKDRGFFTSNRVGGKGRDDIYRFVMPPLLFKLTVEVLDAETNNPISEVEVRLTGSDNSNLALKTAEDGKIMFETAADGGRIIKENTTYTVEAITKKGLLKSGELKKQITTVGVDVSTEFYQTFKMQVITEKTVLRLPEIVYALDKWDLLKDEKTNSEDSLLFLYNILVENPTIRIQLRSHTDVRGSDAYNQRLSQKRAETCVNFLVAKGIPRERMIPVGMGEREPRIMESEIKKLKTKDEQEAAHRYNRRTDFKIIAYDYVPTEKDAELKPIDLPWMKKSEE